VSHRLRLSVTSALYPYILSCIYVINIMQYAEQLCSYAYGTKQFLSDRTNGRAYATVLRPSVVCRRL